MSHCPKCQEPLKEGVAFCMACGEKIRERSGMTPPPVSPAPPRMPGGTPPPVPMPGGTPLRRLPPRKNTSQQQLYTVLAFLFLALTLGFAGWKIRAYLANRQESKGKETVKEIIKE